MNAPHNPNPSNSLKPKGWHSRRHPTREAQDEARDKYMATRGPNGRRLSAMRLAEERAMRGPREQLRLVEKRPGDSTREVNRLTRANF